MLVVIMLLVLGLIGLVYGANLLVNGSIGLANHYKWPTLWVGTVLIGFATTLPEMIVSIIAVLQGHPHISLGNALGSYVANIGMVLGVTAMVQPLVVHKKLLKREMPLLTISLMILFILITDFHLSIQDGFILLLALVGFFWLISKNTDMLEYMSPETHNNISIKLAYGQFIIGAAILWGSGECLIYSAANIAKLLGMSEWAIGLTIVAVGTSLPELAASAISAKKGQHDLAIGNVIGSNVLSILGVVAIPSILAPGSVPKSIITNDISAMAILTIALWLVAIKRPGKTAEITRIEGFIMFVLFILYLYISVK